MKVRSTGSSARTQSAEGTRADPSAADVRARGQRLLKLARTGALAPKGALGLSDASLDALAAGLLRGAALAAERPSSSTDE